MSGNQKALPLVIELSKIWGYSQTLPVGNKRNQGQNVFVPSMNNGAHGVLSPAN